MKSATLKTGFNKKSSSEIISKNHEFYSRESMFVKLVHLKRFYNKKEAEEEVKISAS